MLPGCCLALPAASRALGGGRKEKRQDGGEPTAQPEPVVVGFRASSSSVLPYLFSTGKPENGLNLDTQSQSQSHLMGSRKVPIPEGTEVSEPAPKRRPARRYESSET